MSDTAVSTLTPPGTGAIATVAVVGPRAWEVVRSLFRPAGTRPLGGTPQLHRFWFGTLGDGDEVVLAVRQVEPQLWVEIHCHGGRRVVRWVVEQFTRLGCVEASWPSLPFQGSIDADLRALEPLTHASTTRTASILLDQYQGAFVRGVRAVLAQLAAGRADGASCELAALRSLVSLGRHLVEPWKVAIAGPPNVGKSSLVNALAGYQRSVVSEVAGTTRDVVTASVALDGWPVELADTAGLREAGGLEAQGVERARRFLAEADVCLWVMDAAASEAVLPDLEIKQVVAPPRVMLVVNKVDRPAGWDLSAAVEAVHVSAQTGEGVPGLAARIAHVLVPNPPVAGAAVPFTPRLADLVEAAHAAVSEGQLERAIELLRAATGSD